MKTANIHSFESMAALDGDGIRYAVFFTGCPLGCVYCQNRAISSGGVGKPYSVAELAQVFRSLADSGVHNLNLVTPTHYTLQIAQALELAAPTVPVVYNCGGYELPETLELMRGRVQVFLPDYGQIKKSPPAVKTKPQGGDVYACKTFFSRLTI